MLPSITTMPTIEITHKLMLARAGLLPRLITQIRFAIKITGNSKSGKPLMALRSLLEVTIAISYRLYKAKIPVIPNNILPFMLIFINRV
jgi:hypothetical protein